MTAVPAAAFPRGKQPPKASGMLSRSKSSNDAPRKGSAKRKRSAGGEATTVQQPDFLFGIPTKKKVKKVPTAGIGKGDTSKGQDDEATKLAQAVGLGCVNKSGRNPEVLPISLKTIGRGATLLGMVSRVTPSDVIISLPGGLSGRMPLSEISDPLYTKFTTAAAIAASGNEAAALQAQTEATHLALATLRTDQLVRCAVLSVDKATKGAQRLILSLRGSIVNRGLKLEHMLPGGLLYGAILSEEDHGYVISTGLVSVTAFLPRKNVKVSEELRVGSPIGVVILAVNEASRALTCGFDPQVTPRAITRGSALTLQGLKPGMLINAAVDMTLRNGLTLSFLAGFSGAVTLDHLDRPYQETDWKKRYRAGEMLQARILAIDHQSKSIYLTLRTHLLALRSASGLPEVGEVKEGGILRVEGKKGLLLGLPVKEDDEDLKVEEKRIESFIKKGSKKVAAAKREGEDDGGAASAEEEKRQKILQGPRYVPVFIHPSRVEGKDLSSFIVGEMAQFRVIGIAALEGGVHGSMKASTIEAPYIRVGDVQPGQLVQAEVTSVAGWGLTLDLGQGIRAHCTNMHLADGAGPKATSLRAKAVADAKRGKGVFKAGQKVRCRILQVDPQTRKVYATLKRSMVKDDRPPLNSYADARAGQACLGFVTKVSDFGVIVTFYGNVHGLLPAKHLATQGVQNPEEAFRVGQVLRCVVSSCEAQRTPPRLSLRLDVPEGDTDGEAGGGGATCKRGERVSGVIERVQDPYVSLRLDCGGPLALLHKYQLGDHAAFADQLLSRMSKGERVEDALVFETRRDGEGPLLTVKPLLLRGGGVLDREASIEEQEDVPKLLDLNVGQELAGYISRVETFGLFIRFVGGQVALAPRALIADRFVSEVSGLFREGDSIRCALQRVDADKAKVFVTTKRSQIPVLSPSFLETYLFESALANNQSPQEEEALDWRKYPIGSTVNANVTAIKDYGIVLAAEDHKTVMLAPSPEHVLTCAPNDEVKVRVLDVDWAKRVLVVTLLPDLVKQGRAKRRKTAEGRSLAAESKAEATVVLKRDRYAVVEVGESLAYLAVADYQCPYLATGNLEIGIKVDVVVRRLWRPALEGSKEMKYPQEALMLVTLGQEQEIADVEGAKAKNSAAKVKKAKDKEAKAAEKAAKKAEREAAAAERKSKASTKKRLPVIEIEEIVVGARLPAMISEIRPDELVLTLNVNRGGNSATAEEGEEEGEEGGSSSSPPRKSKGKGNRIPRVVAKVFVTHSGRQELANLNEAAVEARERKEGDDKGKDDDEKLASFHPLAQYEVGQELEVCIIDVRQKELNRMLMVECSLRPRDLAAAASSSSAAISLTALQPSWETLAVGSCLMGIVTEVQAEGLWVALSRAIKGFVHYLEVTRDVDPTLFSRLAEAGVVGLPLAVLVIAVDPTRKRLQLSLRGVPDKVNAASLPLPPSETTSSEETASKYLLPAVGNIVTGRLCQGPHVPALNPPSVTVQLGHRLFARLCITEIEDPDQWTDQPIPKAGSTDGAKSGLLTDGQDVRCRVLSVEGGRVDVSIRPSRLEEGKESTVEGAVEEDALSEEGAVVKGYVVSTTTKGCFVRLSRNVTGRVLIKDLADGFVKSPTETFPVGKLVAGRVLKVDASKHMVDLSLRPSVVMGKLMHKMNFEDVTEGMKVKGAVTRAESYGVFVKLQGSDVTGMCHISEASDQRVKDLSKLYEAGDVVKAYVLKVDSEAKRVSLSLKASRFKGDKEEEESEEEEEQEEAAMEVDVKKILAEAEESDDQEEDEEEDDDDDDDDDDDADDEEEEEGEEEEAVAGMSEEEDEEEDEEEERDDDEKEEEEKEKEGDGAGAGGGGAATGFEWDDFDLGMGNGQSKAATAAAESSDDDDDDESESDDEEGMNGKKRKSRSSRKNAAKRKREEAEVREREERLLDPDAPPETADDFERHVLANPNSSYLWIKYMAFQLSLADIDAARALAGRALKTIVFREEGEKMNVWVALLNLEHKYGTKETVMATLERAAQQANPKHIYLQAMEMYERGDELKMAEELYKIMTKRFKYSKKVWMRYHVMALKQDPAEATELLRRSLQCLSKHKHALVISHFAQAELEHGSVDRGRTIFEGLVSSYPKRLDLWNVYVDKEIKGGHIDAARRLLDRMCTLSLSAQKIKGVLKKYLKLEMDHGDEASIEAVREKAREYVESSMA